VGAANCGRLLARVPNSQASLPMAALPKLTAGLEQLTAELRELIEERHALPRDSEVATRLTRLIDQHAIDVERAMAMKRELVKSPRMHSANGVLVTDLSADAG
jgi:hypothetical protein